MTCGATTGPTVALDLRHLFARQLTLLGSYMGTMGELREVLGHVFAGRLKPCATARMRYPKATPI